MLTAKLAKTLPPVDLLWLTGRDTRLRRIAATRGGEYAGPCPFCGGVDRFHVQPDQGLWYCRRCSDKWRGPVAYVCRRDGVSVGTAITFLQGGTLPDKQVHAPARMRHMREPLDVDPLPSPEAEATWHEIATRCHATLLGAARPLAWLAERGITLEMARGWQLGYVPGKPGQAVGMEGKRVQAGITIPLWGIDGHLYGISVRRAAPPPWWKRDPDARVKSGWKYQDVEGSRKPLFGTYGREHPVLVVVEGWFDAILVHELAADLVDAVAVGSTSSSVHQRWHPYLLAHARWLVVYDNDAPGSTGARGWLWSDRTEVVGVPRGKDVTDFVTRHGGDLRGWLAERLLTMEPLVPLAQAAPIVHAELEEAGPRPSPDRASIPPGEDRWLLYGEEAAF
jgi:hypothetical protein